MGPENLGRGTVLAGRYTLTVLLSDHDGALFWRAQDGILSRDVAVHVVALADPRADAMLEAARLAAVVLDARLLRVLDADVTTDEDGEAYAYVVHEWGEGRSVDRMLIDGPLTPRRAAWLVKEVAECLAACHVQGIAHGRLLPENVLINEVGGVKLVGFVVDSSLHPGPLTWEPVGETLQEHEADMVNLASLLYACLTGRWPGTDGSDVPAAPTENARVLRPRQVRAGVPRPLDRICTGLLGGPGGTPREQETTAHEVATALAAYVGDPSPSEPRLLQDPAERRARTWDPAGDHRRAVEAEDTALGLPVFFDDDTAVGWSEGTPGTSGTPGTRSGAGADGADDGQDGQGGANGREAPGAGPPPTSVDGVRPLFADDDPRAGHTGYTAERASTREPAEARDSGDFGSFATSGSLWPLVDGERPDERAGRSGRGWMRLAAVLTVLLVGVAAVLLAFNLGQRSSLGQLAPEETSASAAAEASPADDPAAGGADDGPWPIRSATDFDPQGSDGENPELVADAVDGDPATAWRTLRYNNRPTLGGLKDGVGLVLDLGEQRDIGSVRLALVGSPTSLEVLAAPGRGTAPQARADFSVVGEVQDAGERVTVDVADGTTTRYVGIWLTSLPQVAPDRFQGRIADVTVLP